MKISDLVGKVPVDVIANYGGGSFIIKTDTHKYVFEHDQDCCESVYLQDVIGDINDLIGCPLLMAEKVSDERREKDDSAEKGADDSFTWTFYKFGTIKGYVTVRFFGTSNGYYSEGVSLHVFEMD